MISPSASLALLERIMDILEFISEIQRSGASAPEIAFGLGIALLPGAMLALIVYIAIALNREMVGISGVITTALLLIFLLSTKQHGVALAIALGIVIFAVAVACQHFAAAAIARVRDSADGGEDANGGA